MKTRQNEPLTIEDQYIWIRAGWGGAIKKWARESDRRDADLMLVAQQMWSVTVLGNTSTMTRIDIRGTDNKNELRADISNWAGYDIKNFE